MKSCSLFFLIVLTSSSAYADGLPEEFEVKADDYPPASSEAKSSLSKIKARDISPQERNAMEDDLEYLKKEQEYVKLQLEIENTRSQLKRFEGLSTGSSLEGVYVTQIYGKKDDLTAEIFYKGTYQPVKRGYALDQQVIVDRIDKTQVTLNVNGKSVKVGLSPQGEIESYLQAARQATSGGQSAGGMAQPLN
jgi:hypothetical protein